MSGSKLEPDCTNRCRSLQHGNTITSLLTLRSMSEEKMAAYMRSVCANYCQVSDSSGCTALHMAAACGRNKIVKWLSQHKECNVNAKDIESGYTPLHRSLYSGQIHVAISLMQLGANTTAADKDGWTGSDHVVKDRMRFMELSSHNASPPQCEVYVWGSNTNFTLGTGMQHNRQLPELLESFRKQNINIQQVAMHKFHSVFVTCDGRVYSCGHGQGGRLGLKSEQAMLTPSRIKFATPPNSTPELCFMASVSRDHTVLLTDSGTVWTCGLNSHHQLGHTPPPPFLLSPSSLSPKILKPVGGVKGICAARFHSVVWGPQGIMTFGLNAGQLGHLRRSEKENTIVKPKLISTLYLKDVTIVEVAASDGATVVVTCRGDIFVLHEYQCRKITSRLADFKKLVVVGGHLDPRLDKDNLLDRGGEKLQVVVLTTKGELLLWQESSPQLTRCIFSPNSFILVKDIAMNYNQLLFVSCDREAFIGEIKSKKVKKHVPEQFSKPLCHPLLEKKDFETIAVTKIPHAHRAISVTSDMKGRNFALLQESPRQGMTDRTTPRVEKCSTMREHMSNLLLEANEDDTIHDVIFQVGARIFPAHQLIVVSRSKYLAKLIEEQTATTANDDVVRVRVDGIEPDVFHQILTYIYTNRCKLTIPEKLQPTNSNPVEVYLECSDGKENVKDAELMCPESPELISAYAVYSARSKSRKKTKSQSSDSNLFNIRKAFLSTTSQIWKKFGLADFHVNDTNSFMSEMASLQKWDRIDHEELCDVTIRCENNKELRAHKCVLAARLEYFHSMLSQGWRETSRGKTVLGLPVPYSILRILVDFLYQDEILAEDKDLEDMDLLSNLLVVADQLFVERLKEICEGMLSRLITLKNAAELLQLSETYNARQLKMYCLEYVTVNLSAILEARSLEGVCPEVLEELSEYYRGWCPSMGFRIITPYSTAPTLEAIEVAHQTNPILFDSEDAVPDFDYMSHKKDLKQVKKKPRVRKNSSDGTKMSGRMRKESGSSVCSDDFDQGIKPFSFDDLVEKSPPKLDDCNSISCKENIDKNSQWIKIPTNSKQQKILQARLKAISTGKESSFLAESLQESFTPLSRKTQSSPTSTRTELTNKDVTVIPIEQIHGVGIPAIERLQIAESPPKPITSFDFPALGASPPSPGFNHHHKAEKHKHVEVKKPVKLSQKQRKRLTSVSDIGLMADHLDALNQSPPLPAWSRGSPEAECVGLSSLSLADIMRQELYQTKSTLLGAVLKRPIVQEEAPKTPTRSATNPWAKLEAPEMTSAQKHTKEMSFMKIVADEKKSKDNLAKMLTKSLELTQIEDQAISDLLQFYNAAGATEERITVHRVIVGPIAAPTWITNR